MLPAVPDRLHRALRSTKTADCCEPAVDHNT